jgi:hypothetical protein
MGKLAGLLSSGIGLAVEASSAYRSPNRPASEPCTPFINRQERTSEEPPPRYEEYGYPISNGGATRRQSFQSEKTTQDEEQKIQERQSYSNYGDRSVSVYEEEDKGDNMYRPQSYASTRPNWPSQGEQFSSDQYYSAPRPNGPSQGEYYSSENPYARQGSIEPSQGNYYAEESYSPQGPGLQSQGEYFSSAQGYLPPSPQTRSQSGLSIPVIIPQRRPGDRSRGWTAAYAPTLQDCGIDQATFINFLESFNEASKSSAALDVVNVAAFGVGFAPGITPMIVSMVVPAAVRVAKTKQTESGSVLLPHPVPKNADSNFPSHLQRQHFPLPRKP